MRLTTLQAAFGSASVLFAAQPVTASHGHGHRHAHEEYAKRHSHNHDAELPVKRSTCSLPNHPDLVYVPGALNNGFAMSPDEECKTGKWCPYACVPGKVMAQWEPNSTYVYPESMNGGLYCNGGVLEKPFPNKPYCVDGTGTVKAVNKCGRVVSFCQTVLPGNEAMIIPTDVNSDKTLAVPDPSYWAKTAAHYYINEPGVGSGEGCVWGDPSQPIGNWSPYVAGANTVDNGDTYVKIGWNPVWLAESSLSGTKPNYGVKIDCPGGGCNGMPCGINPETDGINGVGSPVGADGVEDARFCVVTIPKGKTANIVVFYTDGSTGPAPSSSKPPKPSTTSTTSTSTTAKPTTSSTTSTTSEAKTTSSSSIVSSSSEVISSTSEDARWGGVFHENVTYSTVSKEHSSHITTAAPTSTTASDKTETVSTTSRNDGAAPDQGGTAIAGLVVALVAAAALY